MSRRRTSASTRDRDPHRGRVPLADDPDEERDRARVPAGSARDRRRRGPPRRRTAARPLRDARRSRADATEARAAMAGPRGRARAVRASRRAEGRQLALRAGELGSPPPALVRADRRRGNGRSGHRLPHEAALGRPARAPFAEPGRPARGRTRVPHARRRPRHALEGFELARTICGHRAVRDLVEGELVPGERDTASYVRETIRNYFHPAGTCPLGTVVDTHARVFGVDGLYVADASFMPTIPRANTNLTTAAIAERIAADFA